jgi:hypothetical protein
MSFLEVLIGNLLKQSSNGDEDVALGSLMSMICIIQTFSDTCDNKEWLDETTTMVHDGE